MLELGTTLLPAVSYEKGTLGPIVYVGGNLELSSINASPQKTGAW